jgi:hypothetical protein
MRSRLFMFALLSGALVGAVFASPTALKAEQDPLPCQTQGCCGAYTSECGSALEWRCCAPQGVETPCSGDCVNYCCHQTNCTGC